jgi:hypothetical protein
MVKDEARGTGDRRVAVGRGRGGLYRPHARIWMSSNFMHAHVCIHIHVCFEHPHLSTVVLQHLA